MTDRKKQTGPISREREAINRLVESGKVRWIGGKPSGMKGITAKGKAVSRTVLKDRR